jgi:hypothetical protein
MISPMTMNSGTVASAVVVAVVKMLLANMPKPAGPSSTRIPATLRMRNDMKTGMASSSRPSSSPMPPDSAIHQVTTQSPAARRPAPGPRDRAGNRAPTLNMP